MKKIILIILIIISSFSLYSCDKEKDDTKLNIVVTMFPEYDWVKNIVLDDQSVNLVLLQQSGSDLHNFNPTAKDILTIIDADLFIYNGGESDNWVNNVFESSKKEINYLNLLESLGSKAKEEEDIEGLFDEEEDSELDEHIWLSLRNAKYLVEIIKNELIILNPNMKDKYELNAKDYISNLDNLDNKYQSLFDKYNDKVILLADRFPFRYLVDDYGIKYYAAFKGCQAEVEASAKTITFLADKINELNLKTIFVLETSDSKLANTIIETANNQGVLIQALNSLQSYTTKDNYNYLEVMDLNLERILNSFE